jgi:O-acetyl-ADP-ribose deacetylase (regulator of RNase III)
MSTPPRTEMVSDEEARAVASAHAIQLLATASLHDGDGARAEPPGPTSMPPPRPSTFDVQGLAGDGKAPEPGATFHGLKVHSRLGEGGMGAAFLASHPVLRMPLVIKTFKVSVGAQIFREAHLAARVSSPHVVAVLDAGVEDGVPFVVQRYVDGIDLEELLGAQRRIGRRLPVSAVCRLVLDAAAGLQAIHQSGVVHCDVKPANVFLCGNGLAALGDFGIATESRQRDESNRILGTPHFMAPEQWNQAAIDRRTDLYALGATAHMLATNETAFRGDSAIQLGIAHVSAPYAPPPPRDPREAYLFSVVERLMRKRADDRYPSAEAVARDLAVVGTALPRVRVRDERRAQMGEVRVELFTGDLAAHVADVIVNAANVQMVMDAGVARALRERGGAEIEAAALAHAPVAMGEAVWTTAGALQAQWVAHAVAALEGAMCVQRAALRVLLEAEARRCESVAFPALGTGIGDVPMALGAQLLLEAVRTFASLEPEHVRDVRVVLYDDPALAAWSEVLSSM